jgi:hypothetical protein
MRRQNRNPICLKILDLDPVSPYQDFERLKTQKNYKNNCKNVFPGRYSLTFEDLWAMFADNWVALLPVIFALVLLQRVGGVVLPSTSATVSDRYGTLRSMHLSSSLRIRSMLVWIEIQPKKWSLKKNKFKVLAKSHCQTELEFFNNAFALLV